MNQNPKNFPSSLEVMQAISDDELTGWCLACGAQFHSGIEPDGRGYECEECGEKEVFGAEEILIMEACKP